MKTVTITDNTCFMTSKVGDIEYRHFKEGQELIPETFEELKELCKDYSNITIKNDYLEIIIKEGKIVFYNDGYIFHYIYVYNREGGCWKYDQKELCENRTPQQMWNIIKALVEE